MNEASGRATGAAWSWFGLAGLDAATRGGLLRLGAVLVAAQVLLAWWFSGRAAVRAEESAARGMPAAVEAHAAELAGLVEAEGARLRGQVDQTSLVLTNLTSSRIDALTEQATDIQAAIGRSDEALQRMDRGLAAALDDLRAEEQKLRAVQRDLDDLLFRVVELNGSEGFELARSLAALARSMEGGSAVDQLTYLRLEVQDLRAEVRAGEARIAEQAGELERLEQLLLGGG